MSHRSSKSFTDWSTYSVQIISSLSQLLFWFFSNLHLCSPVCLHSCTKPTHIQRPPHPSVPRVRTKTFGERAFSLVLQWNSLPAFFATSQPLLSKRPWPTFSNSIIRSSYFMCFTCSPYWESFCHDHPLFPPPPPPHPPSHHNIIFLLL